jgi:hypothetical protein
MPIEKKTLKKIIVPVLIFGILTGCAAVHKETIKVPENVINRDGTYFPAEGCKWANPHDQEDLSVVCE